MGDSWELRPLNQVHKQSLSVSVNQILFVISFTSLTHLWKRSGKDSPKNTMSAGLKKKNVSLL